MASLGKLTIICGHYGSGKTNLAINLATDAVKKGAKVTLVDMDIVNPYFTSSEYSGILRRNGVDVISPVFAGTNMEITSLPASVSSALDSEDDVIVDAGGDDVGAVVLGRYSKKIREKGYEMLYVTNMYRPMTRDPKDSADVMRSIENACGLKATAVVNNSHLKDITSVTTITDSLAYARDVAKYADIPLLFSTAPRSMMNELPKDEYFYPTDVYVKTVWEKGEARCQK